MAKSYFQQRMDALGITDEINKTPHYKVDVLPERKLTPYKDQWLPFFSEEKNDQDRPTGNILIHYYTEEGLAVNWKKPGTRWARPFTRKRLQFPKGDNKYLQDSKSGVRPFITPKVIQAYLNEDKIETLVLTEGEFKAFKGDMEGAFIIGLPSIQGFYSGEVKGEINHSILKVVLKCKVENIILLHDADAMTINWKKDKELSKRPNDFLGSVTGFREALEIVMGGDSDDQPVKNIFYYTIRPKFIEQDAKGLDDLLCTFPAQSQAVIKELTTAKTSPTDYFEGTILTNYARVSSLLKKKFGLGGDASAFYEVYKKYIGNRVFVFRGRRYAWTGDKLEYQGHDDAEYYVRVGPDWYKRVLRPVAIAGKAAEKHKVEDLEKWKVGEITRDYRKYPDFFDQLSRFDGFHSVPVWEESSYKRRIGSFYNLMNPLPWTPKEGEIRHCIKFLKHAFQGESHPDNLIKGDPFTVALDYLTLLYQKPTQQLPVPILVSEENGTGKSTFLNWLKAMYGSNAVIMNNQQFSMSFNSHYASKFIIGIDESFMEVEKKAEKERMKQLVTAREMMVQFKGADLKSIPFYGKAIMCSNDADRIMKIDEGESRWFINKVPVVPKHEKDPHLEEKMVEEIPAFLHYLKHREVFHPDTDRLWFSEDDFKTPQFAIIVHNTRTRLEKLIDGFIKDTFLTFKLSTLKIPCKQLAQLLNQTAKFKLDETDLMDYLKKKGLQPHPSSQRWKFPLAWQETIPGQAAIHYMDGIGRYLKFEVEEWLSDSEMQDFKSQALIEFPDSDKKQLELLEKAHDDTPANF